MVTKASQLWPRASASQRHNPFLYRSTVFANKLNERDSRADSSPASRRCWATGIIASVVLHVAIAAALVVGGMRDSGDVVVRPPNEVMRVTSQITLLSVPDPAPQALQPAAPTAPQQMATPTSPAPAPMAPAPAFVTTRVQPPVGSAAVANANPISVASTTTAGAPADLAAIGSNYRRRLLEHIAQRQKSPPAGLPLGTVVVRFSLARDGDVLSIALASSSGNAALDRVALDSVRDASPMPPIPAGFPDRLAVAIPIDFGQPGRQIGMLRP